MVFETKEQVLEKIMSQDKPKCPACEQEMNLWEVPPVNFSDGLGWGTPYLYICFNDDCPIYQQGWENLKENYAQTASYRQMCYPGTEQFELMPVFSPMGGQGQIIDDEIGHTLVAASTSETEVRGNTEGLDKTAQANVVGKMLAERALAKGVTEVVFYRGGYRYHGRVRALAEGTREGGLEF